MQRLSLAPDGRQCGDDFLQAIDLYTYTLCSCITPLT